MIRNILEIPEKSQFFDKPAICVPCGRKVTRFTHVIQEINAGKVKYIYLCPECAFVENI